MRIKMENVEFGYENGPRVLNDVNLDLEGAGLYCIIGPNGVGKSTLVKCINGLLRPTSGKVYLDNRDLSEYTSKEIAERIGYVPVHTDDMFSMTVFETVMIGRGNRRSWRTSTDDILKVHRVLDVFGMEGFAGRKFNELSAGQHQKVALARGLVQETDILLLDEPTSNLDIRHQIFVAELLREIAARKNIMVIMISHNLDITAKYADKVIMMSTDGSIKTVGTANEVITSENLRDVYDVETEIIIHEGRPAILINQMERCTRHCPIYNFL